jgi:NPCBM/NEW2 domain
LTGPTGVTFSPPTAPTEAVGLTPTPGATRKRSRRKWLVGGLAAALLLAATGGSYVVAGGSGSGDSGTATGDQASAEPGEATSTTERETTTTTEPELDDPQDAVGLDVDEASSELTSAGFTVDATETIDETAPDGQVLSASEEGGTVILTVARRPVTRYLADLPIVEGNGYTGLFNLSGTAYAHAIYLDAYCHGDTNSFQYDLGRNYRKIVGPMGLADDSPSDLRVRVEVFLDGALVQTNDIGLGEAVPVDQDVTNVLRLKVQATNLSDHGCDGGVVLGDPQLKGVPSEVPPLVASETG